MTRLIKLSDVVAHVESGGNPVAMRYEPTYNPSETGISNAFKFATGSYISAETAKMICMTSWGLYQIMGDNLYNVLTMKQDIVVFLNDILLQLTFFEHFISKIGFVDGLFGEMSPEQIDEFAVKYNGSILYAEALKNAYKTIG